MVNVEEIAKELLAAFHVEELYQISERDFYSSLGLKFPIWRMEYGAMVGLWSESVNSRRRSNGGVL